MASTSGGRNGGNGNHVHVPSSNACFLFHLLSFLIFLYVFCWHFSKKAASLPQAWEFGWFFKFLTFCGFTFQTVSLLTCVLAHLFPEVKGVKRTANDLSCASFEIANVVTVVYWAVLFWSTNPAKLGMEKAAWKTLQQGLMTGAPLWLSLVVNGANACVAWADILISERHFRKWSLYIALLFGAFYTLWVHICEAQNEEFPYPFSNRMRQPEGTIMVSLLAFVFILIFHKVGCRLASRGSSPLLRKIKLG